MSAADELILTEMIFAGVFNELTAPQIAALLSCFVFQVCSLLCEDILQEKGECPKLAEELAGCLQNIQSQARKIAKISSECKLEVNEEAYVESFKPTLMDVVHAWCEGASFSEILKKTEVFEGLFLAVSIMFRLHYSMFATSGGAAARDGQHREGH